jgi:hypothetical protein
VPVRAGCLVRIVEDGALQCRPWVERADVEVAELRAELVAQLVARALGQVAQGAEHPAGVLGQLRQPVRAEHDQGHNQQYADLERAQIEEHALRVTPGDDLSRVKDRATPTPR